LHYRGFDNTASIAFNGNRPSAGDAKRPVGNLAESRARTVLQKELALLATSAKAYFSGLDDQTLADSGDLRHGGSYDDHAITLSPLWWRLHLTIEDQTLGPFWLYEGRPLSAGRCCVIIETVFDYRIFVTQNG